MIALMIFLILGPIVGGLIALLASRSSVAAGRSVAQVAALAVLVASIAFLIEIGRRGRENDVGVGANTPTVAPLVHWAPSVLNYRTLISVAGRPVIFQFELGADGIGAALCLMTAIIGCGAVVVAARQIEQATVWHLFLLLCSQAAMTGVFLAMDLVTLYVFFEASLIPLVALIGNWGAKQAWRTATYFLIFTMAGSVPLIVGLLECSRLVSSHGSTYSASIPLLSQWAADSVRAGGVGLRPQELWCFWLVLFGFGVKSALLPLHLWLSRTYSAAHPVTTAVLSAVAVKMGLFGLLRVAVTLMPGATAEVGRPVLLVLGAMAILYGAFLALAQRNLLLVLAYSSLSHVGFITMGMFSLSEVGVAGSMLQMINHGLTTGGLFLTYAILTARHGAMTVDGASQGLAANSPRLSACLIYFTLAGVGLPGLNNFVGEVMAMLGVIPWSIALAAIAASGGLFGAWYALRAVQKVLMGSSKPARNREPVAEREASFAEFSSLIGIGMCCLVLGIFPMSLLSLFGRDARSIIQSYDRPAVQAAELGPAHREGETHG